jgi:hypothetical protein
LVWDPTGVIAAGGNASTTEGYPWLIVGAECDAVTDEFLYCNLQ